MWCKVDSIFTLSEGTAPSCINHYLQPNEYGQGMWDLVFPLRTTSPGDSRTGTNYNDVMFTNILAM